MNTKENNLRRAFRDIKSGKIIKCKNCTIWYDYSKRNRRHYIYWQNYGSSADRPSLENLRWIFETVAKSDDYTYTYAN